MGVTLNFTGFKYGDLTVIDKAPSSPDYRAYWNIRCKCGERFTLRADSIQRQIRAKCRHVIITRDQKASNKIYYDKHQKRQIDYHTQYRTTLNGKFGRQKGHAKDRGLLFTIEKPVFEVLITSPCFYCAGGFGKVTGLDRIDNSRGYSIDNVVPACAQCNRCRSNKFTKDEFKAAMAVVLKMRNLPVPQEEI